MGLFYLTIVMLCQWTLRFKRVFHQAFGHFTKSHHKLLQDELVLNLLELFCFVSENASRVLTPEVACLNESWFWQTQVPGTY